MLTALLYSSPREMSSLPAVMTAAPMAAMAVPIAAPMPPAILPSSSNLPPAASACSPASSTESPSSSTLPSASANASDISRMACSLDESSFSMPLRVAFALFSWICQFWVRRSFSPKESAAFWSARSRVAIFCFWASIDLPSASFRAVSDSTDLSCLSNCDATSSISEPSTLND